LYINEHFERLSNAEFRKFRQPLTPRKQKVIPNPQTQGTWGVTSFFWKSTAKQALKGKEFPMGHWKSDSLVVLGAGERAAHGEAVSGKGV
jgi:hypothetical protein